MRGILSSWPTHLWVIFSLQATSHALGSQTNYCSIFTTSRSSTAKSPSCQPPPETFLGDAFAGVGPPAPVGSDDRAAVLQESWGALATLQNLYFDPSRNTWPRAVDWTAAVTGTVVTGMLETMTKALEEDSLPAESRDANVNLISTLFDQIVRSFFGQMTLLIELEAYDDMQWVVLEWIEAARLARLFGHLVVPPTNSDPVLGYNRTFSLDLETAATTMSWQGESWIPMFLDRAATFWRLASAGWDVKLCHGGMNWNPRLKPYKNAVTNELWVASSASMYRWFLDDDIKAAGSAGLNKTFLDDATKGYDWLLGINMTNSQGLFVDGYHVDSSIPNNTKCDERSEDVWTYNQAILLTGQRNLFITTGNVTFLHDGHELIQSVINATGWDASDPPADSWTTLPPYSGLGRGGIIEESCDAIGNCTQDGQTFKAVFFLHLAFFCEPLDIDDSQPFVGGSAQIDTAGFAQVRDVHLAACRAYQPWVRFNADAAMGTRDSTGSFGGWWGASLLAGSKARSTTTHAASSTSPTSARTRSHSAAKSTKASPADTKRTSSACPTVDGMVDLAGPPPAKRTLDHEVSGPVARGELESPPKQEKEKRQADGSDPNDRGLGRTTETQAAGLALLRCLVVFSNL